MSCGIHCIMSSVTYMYMYCEEFQCKPILTVCKLRGCDSVRERVWSIWCGLGEPMRYQPPRSSSTITGLAGISQRRERVGEAGRDRGREREREMARYSIVIDGACKISSKGI